MTKSNQTPRTPQLPQLNDVDLQMAIARLHAERLPWLHGLSNADAFYRCHAFIRWVRLYKARPDTFSWKAAAETMPQLRRPQKGSDRESFSKHIDAMGDAYVDYEAPRRPPSAISIRLFDRVMRMGAGASKGEGERSTPRPRRQEAALLLKYACMAAAAIRDAASDLQKRPHYSLGILDAVVAATARGSNNLVDEDLRGSLQVELRKARFVKERLSQMLFGGSDSHVRAEAMQRKWLLAASMNPDEVLQGPVSVHLFERRFVEVYSWFRVLRVHSLCDKLVWSAENLEDHKSYGELYRLHRAEIQALRLSDNPGLSLEGHRGLIVDELGPELTKLSDGFSALVSEGMLEHGSSEREIMDSEQQLGFWGSSLSWAFRHLEKR